MEDLKYVVLFRPIGSRVEFKQIIGRGTRLYPEKDKWSFEIVDYVGATAHFDDPDFDGYPTARTVEAVNTVGDVVSSEDEPQPGGEHDDWVAEPHPEFEAVNPSRDNTASVPPKLYVDTGDFRVMAEGIQVPDTSTGRLRLTEYGEYVSGKVRAIAGSPGDLIARWARGPSREEVLRELDAHGIVMAELAAGLNPALDPLDVLLQLAWNQPARTRAERARHARSTHSEEIAALSQRAQQVLGALLDRYAEHGLDDIIRSEVLSVPPLRDLGSAVDLAREFGGPDGWHKQVDQLQEWLYSA